MQNRNGGKKSDQTAGTIYVNKPTADKAGYLNISIDLAALGIGTGTVALKAFKNDYKTLPKHPDYRILKPRAGAGKVAAKTSTASVTNSVDDSELPF